MTTEMVLRIAEKIVLLLVELLAFHVDRTLGSLMSSWRRVKQYVKKG
jgi:hypothetical protein